MKKLVNYLIVVPRNIQLVEGTAAQLNNKFKSLIRVKTIVRNVTIFAISHILK